MRFVNCAALVAILYINCKYLFLNYNLKLCSSAESGIVLNLFLKFNCSYDKTRTRNNENVISGLYTFMIYDMINKL